MNLQSLTTAEIRKLQSSAADELARRHEADVKDTENRVREQFRAELAGIAGRLEIRQAAAFPKAATPANGNGASAKLATKAVRKTSKAPVKYRDDAGHSWSGRGKQPRWLSQLIAGGAELKDFRVQA
jgi:DNA-binding protein H-NS